MDAMLWELLAAGSPDDQVEVLIKLNELGKFPDTPIEIVAQIGDILSCRIRRADIETIRNDDKVLSMKGPRLLRQDPVFDDSIVRDNNETGIGKDAYTRPDIPFTGKGILIGIADWGFDFTHPNFINDDSTSRFLALWDQGAAYDKVNSYGYGTIHYREDINNALESASPFSELNYHPGKTDLFHQGMHGTHVLDIAAGNGSAGRTGVAPGAGIIAVHLATDKFKDLAGLGTSNRVFDAIHFLDKTAADTPLVINMSVGSHGDAHTGLSLIEQVIDDLVTAKPGRAVVQSCGNYFHALTHTSGTVSKENNVSLEWLISEKDKTDNELEIWYGPTGADMLVSVLSPDGSILLQDKSAGKSAIRDAHGNVIGRYYHRKDEPSTRLNQVLIILDTNSGSGKWQVLLNTNEINDVKYHAWIERDGGGSDNQSRFSSNQASTNTTTGSICNGFHNISVGAVATVNGQTQIGFFSSAGPTWDGRSKPDLTAPGVHIAAAKSASPYEKMSRGELTYKTGTSMAAPYVTGAIALLYEANEKTLSIQEVNDKLYAACISPPANDKYRYGHGSLNIQNLFSAPIQLKTFKQLHPAKKIKMENYSFYNESVDMLSQVSRDQFSELENGNIFEYFENLDSEKIIQDNHDIQKGDILIRRQYGHHNPIWYGIVEFVQGNEVWVHTNEAIKKILINGDLSWELKKQRPDYNEENNSYSRNNYNAFEEDIKVRGDRSATVNLEWHAPSADKGRIYFVTSGGNGALNSPVIFKLSVINTNPHLIRKSGWAVALRLMGKGQPDVLIPLEKQKGQDYLWVGDKEMLKSGDSIERSIPISYQKINEAYQQLNLDDPRMQLEAQLFWTEKEDNLVRKEKVSYFYNRALCNFYLVNPVEFLKTDEITFLSHDINSSGDITDVNIKVKGKDKKIKYPKNLNEIKNVLETFMNLDGTFEVSTTDAEVNIVTKQVTVSLSTTKSDAVSSKVSTKTTAKSSFEIGDKFAKAGGEVAVEIGTEFQNTKTVASQYTSSLLNSQTVQKSFQIQKKNVFTIKKSNDITDIIMKPVFRPVSVKVIRFENIDANGIAGTRSVDAMSAIIWVNETYLFYQKSRHARRVIHGESLQENFAEDDIKAGMEVEVYQQKLPPVKTKYGAWTISITIKAAGSLSGDSGLPVGGQGKITSKFQDGQRVGGVVQEMSYNGFADLLKDFKIEDLSLSLGSEWSGIEISAYANATFTFVTRIAKIKAGCKLIAFKIKEGESPKFGIVENHFDSPPFELKIGGVTTKVYIRYKASWEIDKTKIAIEELEKLALKKLEKEAAKQGVKLLSREAGELALKDLGPVIAAFSVGWDIGSFLKDHTIAGKIAVMVDEKILGDLNTQYQEAGTLGKMYLISKNSPKIIASLIASGVAGVAAGVGDIVLFKIFHLDELKNFGKIFELFEDLMANLPKIGEAWGDIVLSNVIKWAIKFNPKYFIAKDEAVKTVATAIFKKIKPMYRPNGLSDLMDVHLYDIDVDYDPIARLIADRKITYDSIKAGMAKDEIRDNLLEFPVQLFLSLLEQNHLISYNIYIDDNMSMDSIPPKFIDEIFTP